MDNPTENQENDLENEQALIDRKKGAVSIRRWKLRREGKGVKK